ncbi:MAG: hypothetical protein E7241_00720 [Lachnospiraceae bacterium]|nr:hypothetical protein [Lachnospiraceae bacterium]
MFIVLEILKWIGIVLLCILGLILLLVLLALFSPITYNVRVSGNKDDIRAKVKLGWFLYILRPVVTYENKDLKVIVRILGIPINLSGKDKKKGEPAPYDNMSDEELKSLLEEDSVQTGEIPPFDIEIAKEDELQYNVIELESDVSDDGKEFFSEGPMEEPASKKKPKLSKEEEARLREELKREKQAKKEAKKKARQEKIEKIKDIKNKGQEIIEILEKQETKDAIALVKDVIYKILRHICPKKFKGYFEFGMEDPSTTGTVLAAVGATYPIHRGNIRVVPYFDTEEMILEGDMHIKGRIFVCYLLVQGLRILKNKTIMGLIKKAKG